MNNQILEMNEIVPNIYSMKVHAPRIARKAKPGQFVIVMAHGDGERIPFTISDWDAKEGWVRLNFLEAGMSTCQLASLKAGDTLFSLSGPLGKAATMVENKRVLVGGGCYGIGAIYPIARELKRLGCHVTTVVEGRTGYLMYMTELLKSVSDAFHMVTVDDPTGSEAKVKDTIKTLLDSGEVFDQAHFIGCSYMMMKCSQATKAHKLKTYVSLDSLMLDGTGMCGCCRVTVDGKTKFACIQGPEFDGHLVDWEEFVLKKGYYFEEEVKVYHRHACGGKGKDGCECENGKGGGE